MLYCVTDIIKIENILQDKKINKSLYLVKRTEV